MNSTGTFRDKKICGMRQQDIATVRFVKKITLFASLNLTRRRMGVG